VKDLLQGKGAGQRGQVRSLLFINSVSILCNLFASWLSMVSLAFIRR